MPSANTVFLCLLDKADPPQHSFVDGMLAASVAGEPDLAVRLLVSRAPAGRRRPYRYLRAVCVPSLWPRRGLGRLANLLCVAALHRQVRREQSRGRRVVVFVRNDPVLLLVGCILRALGAQRLIFQSSFPHEEASGSRLKRAVARGLYKLAGQRVDARLAVSPVGLSRLEGLFRRLCPGGYIPLLADVPEGLARRRRRGRPLEFVYIGTHSPKRRLATVIEGIACAAAAGADARFRFIGGSPPELARLRRVPGVHELEASGRLLFLPAVPRPDIWRVLAAADVGLSVAPPLAINREMSPTKLAEYLGAGLAVLATRGIPLQEQFVLESRAGVLVPFDPAGIADGILRLSAEPAALALLQRRAWAYARKNLRYPAYLAEFRRLAGLGDPPSQGAVARAEPIARAP